VTLKFVRGRPTAILGVGSYVIVQRDRERERLTFWYIDRSFDEKLKRSIFLSFLFTIHQAVDTYDLLH